MHHSGAAAHRIHCTMKCTLSSFVKFVLDFILYTAPCYDHSAYPIQTITKTFYCRGALKWISFLAGYCDIDLQPSDLCNVHFIEDRCSGCQECRKPDLPFCPGAWQDMPGGRRLLALQHILVHGARASARFPPTCRPHPTHLLSSLFCQFPD